MRATIVDNQSILIDNVTIAEDDILDKAFSVEINDRYIDSSQMQHWDGVYRKYSKSRHKLARPFLAMLKKVCDDNDLPLVIQDDRDEWEYDVIDPENINADFLPGITLEDYQVDCLRKIAKSECMIVNVPTGGGKGELIAGACKAISCPTVILADQTIVIDQLKSRLELRDVSDDVGLFYAGKKPNGQTIVVGTIQSLTVGKKPDIPDKRDQDYDKKIKTFEKRLSTYKTRKKNVAALLQYIKDAEMIIVDEADKCVSGPWINLFRHHFKGRRRFGFSGTPFDESKPLEALILQEHLGSIGFRVSREHLTNLGRIIPCEYYMLAYGMDGTISESSAYDIAYNEHMTYSPKFHKLIGSLCKSLSGDKIGTLILVDRADLGNNLKEYILDCGLRVDFIHGLTPKKQRKEALTRFERRELDVLIGGKIINRGLDLKGGCENLIIATGGKLKSDFIQKIGRALRVNALGKSKIFDILFRCNKYLYSHSKERLKFIISLGYKTTLIFPGGKISGEEFVKGNFRIKKELYNKPEQKVV